ncbi:MAG: non-ribosomal peptide synthetase, partial [Candidatus Rokuibacteriota bacterium]
MYTSGSTGSPKGVIMEHGPLGNLIAWQVAQSGAAAARTLQFASLSFDVSFQEMFATWCAGGTLVLGADDIRLDGRRALDVLIAGRVERLFLPYVALQHLAEASAGADVVPGDLAEIITAGEQLQITPPIVAMLARLGPCSLSNQYGPSETHVVTAFLLEGPPESWPRLPSIGRPIANARIYLLDGALEPVPIGVAGELGIGGIGMARGYLDKPGLTAAQFLPDAFSPVPGARLYRTGDRARYLSDGRIEFLGRTDAQLKVRGFRVEPGEIEAALNRHPSVRDAAVVARDDASGSRRLVAYVCLRSGPSPTPSEFRGFLGRSLPEHMLPSVFVSLRTMPLTPSGKIDRRALPAPDSSSHKIEEPYVAPRTVVESRLAGIWATVLGVRRVGVHDDFFASGGHSLLATQAISRIREAFEVD